MKNIKATLLTASALAVAASQSAFAAITAADETAILAGVTASDATYYKIGAGILVVMAGFWGFRKLQSLLGR